MRYLILLWISLNVLSAQSQIPAFPGAEGGGAFSKGGRGGIVYQVTNLNDSGKGSLRYGLEQLKGPRTIVFRVGGYIHLNSAIRVKDDGFITIAGQTAPGDGITLTTVNSPECVFMFTRCHDLTIRYLRIRKGGTKATQQMGSGLVIYESGKNIIIDHCSVSWASDENIQMFIWGDNVPEEGMHNITLQHTISAEGLNYAQPATGLLTGGSKYVEKMTDISVHHNLFANNKNRNPLLKVASGDIVNNIIYNWSWWATGLGGGIEVDIINNQYKPGPNTKDKGRGEIVFKPYEKNHPRPPMTGINSIPSIFIEGNIGIHNNDPKQDNWDVMLEQTNDQWAYPIINGKPTKSKVPKHYQRHQARVLDAPIGLTPTNRLEKELLREGGVGASKRLNDQGEWVMHRDPIDQRILAEYLNGQGVLVQKVDDVGGWPVYVGVGDYKYVAERDFIRHLQAYQLDQGEAYVDSDGDGMPDKWEDRYGLDKHNKRDAIMDKNENGYDNLEEFLNGAKP
ncbi:MAG: hypothetical protein IE889_04990 [Campylobacterales bacterium]|nr:hypothetical protein [Campylobacterales bacterium]MBD3799054.1 hypothetical protein [Campylobacterota bacterium]